MKDDKKHRLNNIDHPSKTLESVNQMVIDSLDSLQEDKLIGQGGFSKVTETKLPFQSSGADFVKATIGARGSEQINAQKLTLMKEVEDAKGNLKQLKGNLFKRFFRKKELEKAENTLQTQQELLSRFLNANSTKEINQETQFLAERLQGANKLLFDCDVRSPFLAQDTVITGTNRIAPRASNDLKKYIEEEKNLSPQEIKNIIGQLVLGLEVLHENLIDGKRVPLVHRDLKPGNILLFIDDLVEPRRITAKIADFDGIELVNT